MDTLKTLSHRGRAAFAASCCERMLPAYVVFSNEVGWGNPAVLRTSLDAIWHFGQGGEVEPIAILGLAQECEREIPDTEQFSHLLTSASLDASAGIWEALHCLVDGEPGRADAVGAMATDTVLMYVRVVEHLDSQAAEAHPLVKQERERQEDTLAELRGRTDLSPEMALDLRRKNEGRGNTIVLS